MALFRRGPVLWCRSPMHRYSRRVLRDDSLLRCRTFSRSQPSSAQHEDNTDSKRPDGLSDLEWLKLQHYRRWKRLFNEDPYYALFGASNDMLSGKGLKEWEWVFKTFPKWMLKEMEFLKPAEDTKSGESVKAGTTNGKSIFYLIGQALINLHQNLSRGIQLFIPRRLGPIRSESLYNPMVNLEVVSTNPLLKRHISNEKTNPVSCPHLIREDHTRQRPCQLRARTRKRCTRIRRHRQKRQAAKRLPNFQEKRLQLERQLLSTSSWANMITVLIGGELRWTDVWDHRRP
jgi:hypothetical protein